MRLLIATSAPAFGVTWPQLADEQMLCGPRQPELAIGEAVLSRATPSGGFDVAAVVARLPASQKPDIVACVVDGATTDLPRNLSACPAIRVLLIGDSQKTPEGLARLLAYARSEPFDRIIFTHGCLDEPIFAAAGFQQLFWFPGLLCQVRDWILPVLRDQPKTRALGCLRECSERHGALNGRLEALGGVGFHGHYWSDDVEARLEEIAHSQLSLVVSERGEWDDSFFEVLALGGAMVTGNLGSAAGLERLWPEGAPFRVIDDPGALAVAVPPWLQSPESLDPLRLAAGDWYDRFLGDLPRRQAFLALAREGRPAVPGRSAVPPVDVEAHLSAVPGLHLALAAEAAPTVAFEREAPEAAIALVNRFPRLQPVRTDAASARVTLVVTGSLNSDVRGLLHFGSVGSLAPAGFEPLSPGNLMSAAADFLRDWTFQREARAALESGEYPRAIELAGRELTHRPESVEAHLVIADLFVEKGSAAGYQKHRGILTRLAPHDPRLDELARRAFSGVGRSSRRQLAALLARASGGEVDAGIALLAAHAEKNPELRSLGILHAELLGRAGRREAQIEAWHRLARHHPNDYRIWIRLGLARWEVGLRLEGGLALRRAADHARHEEGSQRLFAAARADEPTLPALAGLDRNLVIISTESCRKHGAGVLLARYFGDDRDTITLRVTTFYDGVEEAGDAHFHFPYQDWNAAELETRIRRVLGPYATRRMFCIPHRTSECQYGIAAQEVTGAPLCTFVMDDRNVLVGEVDDVQFEELFRRSSLRLVISSEMQLAYTIKYNFDFDVMPPIVTDRAARRVNAWNPKVGAATHVALVGNIWTSGQFVQLVKFLGRSGLTVDWYGPVPGFDLTGSGITAKGHVSESVLADRLTEYPLVLVPSGLLDGSEDNEWLTRLSLPSRLVFLLQTGTPVLVLGSKDTCASRHVLDLGIGRTLPYTHRDPLQVVSEMTKPATRAELARNAAAAADAFVMPEAGRWIWESLDAGRALDAPFHAYLRRCPQLEILHPPEAAGMIGISHGELAPA